MSQSSPEDVTATYGETTDLSEGERHRLLRAERRRVTLEVLTDWSAPVDVEDLAAAVAEREADGADESTVRRVTVSLHHLHLPKMAEAGVVDYDPGAARVESCPSPPES